MIGNLASKWLDKFRRCKQRVRDKIKYYYLRAKLLFRLFILISTPLATVTSNAQTSSSFQILKYWEHSAPLIAPEQRGINPSRPQKDPSVVFFEGKWHVFMAVKLEGRSAIEYCSFDRWDEANSLKRTILKISSSDYYCAPQVFYFQPHKKWYLIYQMGVPDANKMWVAYSTTTDISSPELWTIPLRTGMITPIQF